MMTICYVFQPKQSLLDVMADYPSSYDYERFSIGQVWTGETSDYALLPESRQFTLLAEAKFALLTRIMPIAKADDTYLQLIHKLFGNPPRYNLENFDRWWTLSILKPAFELSSYWGESVSVEKLEKLEKTGNAELDKWLDEFPPLIREHRQKRKLDSSSQ